MEDEATDADVTTFFEQAGKTVLTFVGYSGKGYDDPDRMLAIADSVLSSMDPATTIVNIGATSEGIGAVYELARRRGFTTTGVVSSVARKYEMSEFVDRIFFVDDASWGGYVEGTKRLSPTSAAMVEATDIMVGIGGGSIARDEMLEARRRGKEVLFFPADMDHEKAIRDAREDDRPPPSDFRGEAHSALAGGDRPA